MLTVRTVPVVFANRLSSGAGESIITYLSVHSALSRSITSNIRTFHQHFRHYYRAVARRPLSTQQFDGKINLPQDAGGTASIPPTETQYDQTTVKGRLNGSSDAGFIAMRPSEGTFSSNE